MGAGPEEATRMLRGLEPLCWQPGWQGWGCSPGKTAQSPLQSLEGLEERWEQTFYQGFLQQDKRGWFKSEEGWIEISYIRFFFFLQ